MVEKAICNECLPGYILLASNNSCLEIIKNKELQNFEDCVKLTMENNKLVCLKCKSEFSLIKRNNINECAYIPTLYNRKFRINYENHFYNINQGEVTYSDFTSFRQNDYIYNKYINYYPCQEAENLGTEENPLYSCTKCYEFYGDNYNPVRITEENSKVSFCMRPYIYEELEDCTEATMKIKNGTELYTVLDVF